MLVLLVHLFKQHYAFQDPIFHGAVGVLTYQKFCVPVENLRALKVTERYVEAIKESPCLRTSSSTWLRHAPSSAGGVSASSEWWCWEPGRPRYYFVITGPQDLDVQNFLSLITSSPFIA